jgi:two-component system chemotaxis response regulator CheY
VNLPKEPMALEELRVLYLHRRVLQEETAMGRGNILVVEDSFAVARRLQLSLQRAGFTVEIARNGRDALIKARKKRFDVIVTDECMPVMSGRQLCHELREDRRYSRAPIVFLTANPRALDTEEMMQQLSVAAVFEKPFHPEAILHLIENELLAVRTS